MYTILRMFLWLGALLLPIRLARMMAYIGGYPTANEQSVRAQYDFDVDGGAQGAIDLTPTKSIPEGAVITRGYIRVRTVLAGAGSSVALRLNAASDIHASTGFNSAPWNSVGQKDIIPDGTGSTAVVATADRALQAIISGAALTAGKFDVVLFYTLVPD